MGVSLRKNIRTRFFGLISGHDCPASQASRLFSCAHPISFLNLSQMLMTGGTAPRATYDSGCESTPSLLGVLYFGPVQRWGPLEGGQKTAGIEMRPEGTSTDCAKSALSATDPKEFYLLVYMSYRIPFLFAGAREGIRPFYANASSRGQKAYFPTNGKKTFVYSTIRQSSIAS